MKKKLFWINILIFSLVIVSFIIYHYFMHGLKIPNLQNVDVGIKGMYGDSFGALTSLFTGLAFAGLIATILLQKTELKAQRQEFEKLNLNHTEMLKLTAKSQLIAIYQDRLDRNYRSFQESLNNRSINELSAGLPSPKDPFDNENKFLIKSRDAILDSIEKLAEVDLTSNRIQKSISQQ